MLLGALALYLGMVGLGLFWLPWFSGAIDMVTINIHLLSIKLCSAGECASVSFKTSTNAFTLAGGVTLAGTVVFGLLVTYQATNRLRDLDVSEGLTSKGYLAAVGLLLVTALTGFVLGPEIPMLNADGHTLRITATSARLLVLASHVLGIVVLALASAAPAEVDAPVALTPRAAPGLPPAYGYRGGARPSRRPRRRAPAGRCRRRSGPPPCRRTCGAWWRTRSAAPR